MPILKSENPKQIENDLEAIRSWIQKQPHLIARNDDEFLISFLRFCKFRLEVAKEKLDYYFSFRSLVPEYFNQRVPLGNAIRRLVESYSAVYLPEINPNDQTKIIYAKLDEIIKCNAGVADLIGFQLMAYDRCALYDYNMMTAGVTVIFDIKGGTLEFGAQFLPHLKKMAYIIQHAYPIRLAGLHFVNMSSVPAIYGLVVRTLRKFLSSKLAERIFVHDNFDTVFEKVSKNVLPSECGGDAGSVASIMSKTDYNDKFLSEKSQDWYKFDLQFRSDESKRIGKLKDNEFFGADGTFKKLDID